MTAKKETKQYVLFDPYGDVVTWGTKDDLRLALEDALEYEADLPDHDTWKVYELGPKVALSYERELQLYIGRRGARAPL
jgi:hypothetical protein